MAESGATLIELLLQDHLVARRLLERFDDLPADSRTEPFRELAQTLSGHERAEEEVLYPVVRQRVEGGDELAGRRLEEQAEAEELLSEMRKADTASVEFMTTFANLRDAVLQHAEAEENSVFPELAAVVDAEDQRALGRQYEQVKVESVELFSSR